MIYKYEEVDINNGDKDEEGVISTDATVFVSDGGIFRGVVAPYGTLIIRGGEAHVIIRANGRVIAHGGVLHAIVQQYGSLHVHEGKVFIKEEGGYVQANENTAYVTYEPSEIRNMAFNAYTTIHENTKAIDCDVPATGLVTIHRGGIFTATKRMSLIRGTLTNSGYLIHAVVDYSGKVSCTDSSIIKRCMIDHGGTIILASTHGASSIIVKDGTLDVDEHVQAINITLHHKGTIVTHQQCYVTYRDKGGTIVSHGGKAVRIKPK